MRRTNQTSSLFACVIFGRHCEFQSVLIRKAMNLVQPHLSIIIVNWNVAPLLARCLHAIETHLRDYDKEIFVVDNASSDESLTLLKHQFPQVIRIENKENLGFAKANNQAFRRAQGKYILVLNPDTEIHPFAIQKMMAVLDENKHIGLVGPKVLTERGHIVRACRRSDPSLYEIAKGLFLTDKFFDYLMRWAFGTKWVQFAERKYARSGPCECLQGSCMLMRREDLYLVGFFDERIPLYLDDNDLCKRFRNKGLDVFYLADAHITHVGAQSVHKMANSRMSSMVGCLAIDAYFHKHGHIGQIAIYHLMLLFSSIIFLAVDLLLLPFLWFSKRAFIRNYFIKHCWTLCYSLTFQFRTKHLPPSWPRSFGQVLNTPSNEDPNLIS